MKLSIITCTFNSEEFIGDCIASVNFQRYTDVEHIIVDGKSVDSTLSLLEEVPSRITEVISEKDKGIYDAMNKGVKVAKGEVVGILNSDDFYASGKILTKVAEVFENTGCDAVYGNLDFVNAKKTGKVIRHWKSKEYKPGSFTKGWHPPHPTFFVRKEVYEKFGYFDISLNVSADFELMLRFIEKHGIHIEYLDETLVKMRYGGESTGSLSKIIEGNRNIMKAFKKNSIPVSPFYPVVRLFSKIKQFLKR